MFKSSTTSFVYPTNDKVKYTTDAEYRQSLRNLFKMNEHLSNNQYLDEISKDENNYDEQTVKLWIDWISEETQNCYELNELYKLAAATMISLDRHTGLAVLFSFDYFEDFHSLLSIYFKNVINDLEMTSPYERLWNRLIKK